MRRALFVPLLGMLACVSFRNSAVDAGAQNDDAREVVAAADAADASLDATTAPEHDAIGTTVAATKGERELADGAAYALEASSFDSAGGGLDPDLRLPSSAGPACSTPGSEKECPGPSMCRLASPTAGRCESCTNCGNLNELCNASNECDILFQCFRGRCTNFCQLGAYGCGSAISDCLDVGHPTVGMCRP